MFFVKWPTFLLITCLIHFGISQHDMKSLLRQLQKGERQLEGEAVDAVEKPIKKPSILAKIREGLKKIVDHVKSLLAVLKKGGEKEGDQQVQVDNDVSDALKSLTKMSSSREKNVLSGKDRTMGAAFIKSSTSAAKDAIKIMQKMNEKSIDKKCLSKAKKEQGQAIKVFEEVNDSPLFI